MRRLAFLTATVLLSSVVAPVLAASFPDTPGTPYQDAFAYLSDRNIIAGYPDGYGRPENPLNRAEALKVVINLDKTTADRAVWYQSHLPSMSLFSDVDQSGWYAPYIETAFERGIVTGYPDGSFRPGQYLTVEEAVALLMRLTGDDKKTTTDPADLSPYIENQSNAWYTSPINAAIRRNLVMHRGFLRLGSAITRGQFFDIAYRMHVVRSTNVASYTGSEPSVAVAPVQYAQTQPTAPSGSSPYASEKYFSIAMPTLGVTDLTITHPEDPFTKDGILAPLQYGVGHLFSYPGAGGKIMIYGHSSGYPWDLSQYTKIFRQINKLSVGDRVYVTYSGTVYTYEITKKQTVDAADSASFSDDGSGEELILYTCWPPDSISQRYLVHALPVGTVAAR